MAVKEIWSDLHQNVEIDGVGALRKVINIDAVKASIDNILRTSKGERFFLRDFGSNLHGIVFDNLNDSINRTISDGIKDSINKWDNRIIVNAINITKNPDRNEVSIEINFSIRGYDKIFSHSVNV